MKSYSINTPSTTTALSLQNTPTIVTSVSSNNQNTDRTPAVIALINNTHTTMPARLTTTQAVACNIPGRACR